MKKRQQNTHNMHLGVLALLDREHAKWDGKRPVETAVEQLRDAVGAKHEARTAAIATALGAADEPLDDLDDLVPGLRDPMLTAEYRRARRTDDR